MGFILQSYNFKNIKVWNEPVFIYFVFLVITLA